MGSELALVRVGQTSPQKLHRYLGQHLLLAYSWFFLGLVLVIVWAAVRGGSALYDASVHSLAVGFVGTMILAHAPVIAPAILPRTIAQEKLNLLPLELLTVGNLLRVGGYVLKGAGLPPGYPRRLAPPAEATYRPEVRVLKERNRLDVLDVFIRKQPIDPRLGY